MTETYKKQILTDNMSKTFLLQKCLVFKYIWIVASAANVDQISSMQLTKKSGSVNWKSFIS